ncbi:hypothetical protein M407DRAFT_21177 [Tulasnella calospora MUT 4182]|uniref:Major facilitator superfamily (MFS) profile domain-containing protein n=1 Tax=Tulasnella calospora MUT 4182 TaxID=1051891 RepID=A0A0C3QET0_9AGAM|nr:hypothetical protein M407DRAFT_21177 [Tulasnella calospora MUT 4182]
MDDTVQPTPRRGLGKVGLIFACGTALFSDGYQNGVIGTVNTLIKIIYKDTPGLNLKHYTTTFSSLAFAGTFAGMLIFGLLSDRIGRKFGMILATLIVFLFAALSAGAYGAGGSVGGMLAALSAYRFLIGIGIGAEYPAGSVAAAENTEDPGIKSSSQHMLFALATDVMIDWGFVISAFTPLVLLWIFGEDHLRIVWRGSLALGTIPPLLVLYWRVRMHEPERFRKESMNRVGWKDYPVRLIVKRYWLRFIAVSLTWFIYCFITYPLGIYSSTITTTIIGDSAPLTTSLGWNVVINLFYIPGCMIGAVIVDKEALIRTYGIDSALVLQGIFGFAMSGAYTYLATPSHIAGFTIMYGLFLSLGELGPGICLGLLASKSSPTAFRGMFYGGAAAIGKVGAFAGTWAFPAIIDRFPAGPQQDSGPFWIGSGLSILSAAITFFFIPEVPENHMTNEDVKFREYLKANGFDVSLMGLKDEGTVESHIAEDKDEVVDVVRDASSEEDEKKGAEAV